MSLKLDKSLNTDMGRQLASIETFVNGLDAQALANLDVSDLTIATANGSDPATTMALANAIKTAFNTLIARIDALQP
jgi:hypothetical protein